LILSTNVAETSVTIEGITAVIDSGLARISSHSPWSGLPMLKLSKVSKASAVQRAGRAGRTRPGRCLRLYTRQDFETRPDHETPEIQRVDLASAVLGLYSLGLRDLGHFPFFEAPPAAAMEAAQTLLQRLGAASSSGELTPVGRRLLELPLHPRLGMLVLEGERRGISSEAVLVAALLGERDIRHASRTRIATGHFQRAAATSSPSDLLELLESFQEAERQRFDPRRLRDLGLDSNVVRSVDRVRKQLGRNLSSKAASSSAKVEDALLRCALAAFPDRVAKRRSATSNELLLCEGGTALLDPASAVTDELLVAVDAEERMSSQGARTWVRLASKVEPEWLLDLPHNEIQESDRLEWNAATERVETVARIGYGKIILEESRRIAPPSAQTAELLYKMASAEQGKLFDLETIGEWKERLALLSSAFPSAGFPPPGPDRWDSALRELSRQASSYDELRKVNPVAALGSLLTPEQSRLMAIHAPERIALPGGRQLKVHYEAGKPPWVESRLQDFFGLKEGPRIGGGRLPLVLHLLAPNHRPVQVTSDLSGFWERHYPSIRRELARKYPRHAWPENPLQASPPSPRARR
jgi:ATP-dependent helicase HrpB